jgi:hypothetical protein
MRCVKLPPFFARHDLKSQSLTPYSMNNELTESSLLILSIVSASRLATLN